jgi:hypothetical protein
MEPFRISIFEGKKFKHFEFYNMSDFCHWLRDIKNELTDMDRILPKFSLYVKRGLESNEDLYEKALVHFAKKEETAAPQRKKG